MLRNALRFRRGGQKKEKIHCSLAFFTHAKLPSKIALNPPALMHSSTVCLPYVSLRKETTALRPAMAKERGKE